MMHPPSTRGPEGEASLSHPQGKLQSIAIAASFSGPLPPPSDLARYKEILPDAPDRILKMAEREQEHAFLLERRFLGYKSRGQVFAFFIVIASFLLNAYLATIGYPWRGLIISGFALAGIVGAFIYGRRKEWPDATGDAEDHSLSK